MMSVSQNHHPKPMFSVHSSGHRGPPPQKSTTECRKGRHFVKWLCVRYIATQMWFWAALHLGIYKKPRPFNHIFGGDRNLRAWYRGIKNAGPRKRAQGRAQDIPYQSISPYHHGIWRIFIECGKKPHARKSAQGRSARGPILPKSNRNFRQPPFDKFATRVKMSIVAFWMTDLMCSRELLMKLRRLLTQYFAVRIGVRRHSRKQCGFLLRRQSRVGRFHQISIIC